MRNLKMTVLHENGVLAKAWYFLQTHILTLRRFDLFLQGSLLIVILLEANLYLLLRRDHGGGLTPAYIEDWIIVSAAGVEFLAGAAVGWWGGRRRNFAVSAWMGLAAASGFLVLFVPFEEERSPHVELCGGNPITFRDAPSDSGKTARLALLIMSTIVCSLTKVSIWAHGFTYLDDHDPQNGPYFYGILISIRLSLGLSGQSWLQASSLREDWWKAHLSLCSLTLMFCILFTLFPSQMKQFSDDEQESSRGNFLPTLQRVVRNKVVVLQSVAIALLSAAVFGFVHYDKAYVQARFRVEAYRQDPRSSRTTSDIFRSLVIIFFVMIFRVRFSARRIDGVKANTASRVGGVVAAIVAVLLAVMAALGCSVGEIDGLQEEYTQPACSMQCGCDSARYGFTPVCGLESGTTFFSPCHAGCHAVTDLNGFSLFSNCTCGGQQTAVRGACSIMSCRAVFNAYQIIYTVFLAVAAASFLMQGMAVVRAVSRADKPVAQATSMAVTALLATVLGHLAYMAISYATCAFYTGGRCVLHDEMLWAACCVSAVLALCSAAVSFLSSRHTTIPTTEL